MLTIEIFQLNKDSKIHAIDPKTGRAFCAKNITPANPHRLETVEAEKAPVNCFCCSAYLDEYRTSQGGYKIIGSDQKTESYAPITQLLNLYKKLDEKNQKTKMFIEQIADGELDLLGDELMDLGEIIVGSMGGNEWAREMCFDTNIFSNFVDGKKNTQETIQEIREYIKYAEQPPLVFDREEMKKLGAYADDQPNV